MPIHELGKIFGNEVVVPKHDLLRMYIDIAFGSSNPTIVDALDKLVMLVKIAEAEEVQNSLFQMSVFSGIAETRRMQFNREEIHEIIDEVMEKGDNNSIFALDNLIDVARARRPKKKSR